AGPVAPVVRLDGGGTTWLLEDRLGSVRNVVNGSGVLTGTVVYDGFGNITSETNPSATGRYTFTGLPTDRNAGTVSAHERVYRPDTGNWQEQDPVRFVAGDYKLDRYVHNDPANSSDPSGLVVILAHGIYSEANPWAEQMAAGLEEAWKEKNAEK